MAQSTADADAGTVTDAATDWGVLEAISALLVVVGALNWGLVGASGLVGADVNIVTLLLGWMPPLEHAVYVLVGVAGIYLAYTLLR